MPRRILQVILFTALLLMLFAAPEFLARGNSISVVPEAGVVDLTAVDLTDTIVFVRYPNWEYYPDAFYTPEDFAQGNTPAPDISPLSSGTAEYGTHRLILRLPANAPYGISGPSLLNSQRLYIGGVLMESIGQPGETKESTVPQTRRYFYGFTTETGETEIIFHVANFYATDGGGRYSFYVSDYNYLSRYLLSRTFGRLAVPGCLAAAALFYLGMFLFHARKREFLWFTLICLLVALRILVTSDKLLVSLWPSLPWQTSYALEYLSLTLLVIAFIQYITSLFPAVLKRWFTWTVQAVCGVYSLVIVLTEPLFYMKLLPVFTVVWVASSVLTATRLIFHAIRTRPWTIDMTLVVVGLAVLVGGAVSDLLYYLFSFGAEYMENAMLVCIFLHMVGLSTSYARTAEELSRERIKANELTQTNEMMARLDKVKARFLSDISHEMRTPLTVMAIHAQLTEAKLEADIAPASVYPHLQLIASESRRLGQLVGGLLSLSGAQEMAARVEPVPLGEILRQTVDTYRVLVEKKGNRLTADIPQGLPPVAANADQFIQVFVNILANANEHTAGGEIAVTARMEGGTLDLTFRDTGEGIPAARLATVFDRRAKGDSEGAGLGLSICKKIVEGHGGNIALESEEGKGTTVKVEMHVEP